MSGIPPKEKAMAYIDSSRMMAEVSPPGSALPSGGSSAASMPHRDAAMPEMRASPVTGLSWNSAAEVRGQHLRADDRLGLQHQAEGGQPGQRPERLQQQVRLRLILAVRAHPLPQER